MAGQVKRTRKPRVGNHKDASTRARYVSDEAVEADADLCERVRANEHSDCVFYLGCLGAVARRPPLKGRQEGRRLVEAVPCEGCKAYRAAPSQGITREQLSTGGNWYFI